MKRISFILIAGLMAMTLGLGFFGPPPPGAHADPAIGTPQWLEQPDGTRFQAKLWGDEFANGWETLEGYSILQKKPSGQWVYARRDLSGKLAPIDLVVGKDSPLAVVPRHQRPSEAVVREAMKALPQGPGAQAGPPKSGYVCIPVLLIEFPDKGNTKTAAELQINLFGGGATGPGDLKDYYEEISYNSLTLQTCFLRPPPNWFWVTADNNRDYYNTSDRVRGLVTEAIQKTDAAGFDFAPYDNDNDGSVDAVVVVYAGCDTGNGCNDPPPGALWAHQSTLTPPESVDGKQASVFTIQSELLRDTPTPIIQTIGVFAHELGHTFGLPDLYDIDLTSNGIGTWGLMSYGMWNTKTNAADSPAHMEAWSKWFMGWLNPTLIQGMTADTPIPQVETNATVYQLRSNPNGVDWRFDSSGTGEYFLVENRQQTGFDEYLDGCGLLIWHIDENRPGDNTANADETHKLVDLEEADGQNDLDNKTNYGDTGDPYHPPRGVDATFSDTSTPNSNLYSGAASGASVYFISGGISGCAETMYAWFTGPEPGAVGGIAQHPDIAERALAAESSGGSSSLYAAIAGVATGGALLLAAGGWYARRRWSR